MCISIGFNKTRRPSRWRAGRTHHRNNVCDMVIGFLVHIHFILFVIVEYFLELRFQFVNAIRYGDDYTLLIDEE